MRWWLVAAVSALAVACGDSASAPAAPSHTVTTAVPASTATTARAASSTTITGSATPARLHVSVVARRAHDRGSFTEGLVYASGHLYESAGLYGQSTLREVAPSSGTVLRSVALDPKYFGEGLALVGDRLIQLTWREHTALVYSASDFKPSGTFTYTTEGWGLCDDGARLVMSDGTDILTFRDRTTFAAIGHVTVTNDGAPLTQINELECVDGAVYANVWQTNMIVRIDPSSGRVVAVIDASGLLTADEARGADVLNGIAYDSSTGDFWITGKNWPTLFVVRFV
jgi:glutamine cyclotransferase